MNYYNKCDSSNWCDIPEPILIKILNYCTTRDVINSGKACQRWYTISQDDYLWMKLFHRDFKLDNEIGLKPGAESWYAEYKRLVHHIPMVQTEELTDHCDEVLHVSFAHNGTMFATCSKDGQVLVWKSSYPAEVKYFHDMKAFNWSYTQYSQFNESDTLLLVSGVHFGCPHSNTGEIAVFSVTEDSTFRCRIVNRPYDIFGTWFSDQYLISGDLHFLGNFISTSVLWLNKADQETESENIPITKKLYKFYNKSASSVRNLLIAKCPWLEDDEPFSGHTSIEDKLLSISGKGDMNISMIDDDDEEDFTAGAKKFDAFQNHEQSPVLNCFSPRHELHKMFDSYQMDAAMSTTSGYAEDDDNLEDITARYLIFSCGSKTFTPHQIGFKKIQHMHFPKTLDLGLPLKERIRLRKLERIARMNNDGPEEPDWADYESVANRFDPVDHVIDFHGHIIGMGLSPDHRFLYVNCRPWPTNYIISSALNPPPIAQEIDIHVIDLVTLKHVGKMLRAHKAYTPNSECFFIFLNVCDNYVASGAEDNHAYLWDRYYGGCLAKYNHASVVNCVAFNPVDSEMMVTTSDDHTVKIWRSTAKAKQLNPLEDRPFVKRALELRKNI